MIKLAYTINPYHEGIRFVLGQCFAEQGEAEKAVKVLGPIMNKSWRDERMIFNIQFVGEGYKAIERRYLMELARKWEKNVTKNKNNKLWVERIKEDSEKIRIGYFSQDLCNHPVGRFILTALKEHDRKKFEVFGLSWKIEDEVTREIREKCDEWIDLSIYRDFEGAKIIADRY